MAINPDYLAGVTLLKKGLEEARVAQSRFSQSQMAHDEQAAKDAAYRFFVLCEHFIGVLIEEIERDSTPPASSERAVK